MRLVPLFPYNVLNYALGLTRIPVLQYVAATFLCMAPGAAAYSYLGYIGGEALGGGQAAIYAALWALALLSVVTLLPRFLRPRAADRKIGARELEAKLEAGEPICVVDVRSPDEFHGPLGHIRRARSIPVDRLATRLAEIEECRSRLLVPV